MVTAAQRRRLPQGEEVFRVMTHLAGDCVRLSAAASRAIFRAQRLFFLNEGQSLSNFLVIDLGILRYPEYTVQRTRPVFPSREALLEYEAALENAAALDSALEVRKNPCSPRYSEMQTAWSWTCDEVVRWLQTRHRFSCRGQQESAHSKA